MKYCIIVYGCQMNISDAERVAAVLEGLGYKQTQLLDEADLTVVTMCSIRQSAVDRIHGLVEKFKKIRKTKPSFTAVLTGCVLKRDKKKFIKGFDYIVDIKEIGKLPEILKNLPIQDFHDREKTVGDKNDKYLDITPKYSSKFSASVPIMTGCNNFCAYCVVPYVKDREYSRPAKEIITEIKNLIEDGYKEIWLLGQNVNSYKDADITFPELLKLINKIPGKFWVRFTSSHPKDFNEKTIEALAIGGKITPYLNLPIQSGDDKVLESMNRHYTVKEYKAKIVLLRKTIPHICLSTDIIVGFPGETKKQFENTVKLFEDVKYDMAYINKYSRRAGTAAAKLKDTASVQEKKRREKILNEALKKTAIENNRKYLGKTVEVLIEKQEKGFSLGRTETYKLVKIDEVLKPGTFNKIKITEAGIWSLKGEIVK